jgi:hypothetical protein
MVNRFNHSLQTSSAEGEVFSFPPGWEGLREGDWKGIILIWVLEPEVYFNTAGVFRWTK